MQKNSNFAVGRERKEQKGSCDCSLQQAIEIVFGIVKNNTLYQDDYFVEKL